NSDAQAAEVPTKTNSFATSSVDLPSSIGEETRNLFGATNKANAAAIAYVQEKYSEQVSYFGKDLLRSDVISDKTAFFQKWPVRSYSLLANSLKVECETQTTCSAQGKVEWRATNAKSVSQGVAAFSLGWSMEEGVWKVRSETSKVISRAISRIGMDT